MGHTLNYTWEIFKIFMGLGVVIALVYILSHFLRNSRRYFGMQGSMIQVIDRSPLTQHAQVFIVKVGEKYYLLGLTDEQITVLDTYDDLSFVPAESLPPQPGVQFAEMLKRTFRKKDGGDE